MDKPIELGALWEYKSGKGNRYWSGRPNADGIKALAEIGNPKLLLFINDKKGNAKATWYGFPGIHEVCIVSCDICRKVRCW